jgi:integrase
MELVTIKGGTKRAKKPRSLTVDEFHRFLQHLDQPMQTIAIVCGCLGLRISECLGLKWRDVNCRERTLSIERGIVRQRVDDVKTDHSGGKVPIAPPIAQVFQVWKQMTQFSGPEDWVFASPVQLGRLPWSYPWVWRTFQTAATQAGIATFGTHTLRHSYRSWLDAVGTSIAVQQKLMRHSDIRTTMNVYGDVVTNEMAEAHAKVVQMAIPPLMDRKRIAANAK